MSLRQPLTPPDFLELHPGAWAFGSMLASATSLLVAALGVLFVWQQLKAGREALNSASLSAQAASDAAKIAFDGIRPWLKFEVNQAYIYLMKGQEHLVGCQINYRLENVGKLPAIQTEVFFKPVPSGGPPRPNLAAELASLGPREPRMPFVLFPGDVREIGPSRSFPFPPLPDESFVGFSVVAMVRYKASLDGPFYVTPLVLTMQHATPPADRVYRFWRGMGAVECLPLLLEAETPSPR